MLRSTKWLHAVILVPSVLAMALLGACGDDEDDPPGRPQSDTGIVVVSTQNGGAAAAGQWTLTGPGGTTWNGTGSETFTDMQPGEYSVAWEEITEYETPEPRTGTLRAGRTLTLVGTYDFIEPPEIITIHVDIDPDEVNATWALQIPGGDTIEGRGDSTVVDLPVGAYTITWGPAVGYETPAEISEDFLDQDHDFDGVYIPLADPYGEFVTIPAGSFEMGSATGDADEQPVHTVTLTNDFEMSETEITYVQFAELMLWAVDQGFAILKGDSLLDNLDGSNELLYDFSRPGLPILLTQSGYATPVPDNPIAGITWTAAATYCDWLSLQENLPRAYDHATWQCNGGAPYGAQGYRLPTEAEWEYACRAGTTTALANGDFESPYRPCNSTVTRQVAWYCGNTDDESEPVQELMANPFDLYDMHGNVWEWCNDWYGPYGDGPATDPVGPAAPAAGADHVVRGGSWYSEAADVRSANRYPYASPAFTGLRPVRTLP